ncbi:MAG: bile acid:sodium symporter family protein [Bacteroidetes bacterium]|nr:bile acid:sodium symporter family protein [Bacteroidota bacterium]
MESTFFSQYMLPAVIALIMYNLGLSLSFKDFKRTFKLPKALLIGLCCQMILLPAIAFALAYFSNLPPVVKVGIVLIAACPGGATSNLITYLLKGDVALSISLTSINSILILLSIPGITYLALNAFLDQSAIISMPFLKTVFKILFMILLPTFLGLLTQMKYPEKSKKLEKYLKYITTGLLAIVFTFTIVGNKTNHNISFNMYWETAPYALALNLLGMLSGYLIGFFAGFSKQKVITLVVEIGIQNSALAITIASSQVFLGNPKMAIPAVIYGLFTFFNAATFGYIVKKKFKKH